MEQLVLAAAAFVLTHFVSSTPLRPALAARIGERGYRGLYSLVAFATLVWMIWAYRAVPREMLWTPLRYLPSAVMPLAFILIACGYARNPTAVGAERLLASEQPARGIVRITRHPIMWAIILWSAAHLLARGDAKSAVFFGAFFVLAALGTVLIDRRKSSAPGWERFSAVTSNLPFLAILQGRNRLDWREIGWARPLGGLAIFVIVFWAHPWIFGARPW